jgi:hypothetical protein
MAKWFFVTMMFIFFYHGAGAAPDATLDTFRAEFQNMQAHYMTSISPPREASKSADCRMHGSRTRKSSGACSSPTKRKSNCPGSAHPSAFNCSS